MEKLVARLRSEGYRLVDDGPGRYLRELRHLELARGFCRVQLSKELA